MNKLIIFNEPVKSVRKSQQTIHSQIAMIRLQLFSSRKLTDSNDPFRATDAVKSKLLMSNFRINYCNWK